MNVEIFALCDAATDQRGKLNILGAFDTIFIKDMPGVHPHCAVALRIRFQRIEQGKHKVTIHFIDQDGNLVIPSLDADIDLKATQNQDSTAVNLVLNLQGLKFKEYGSYEINLAVDGRQEASIPLYVKQPS
jgi:hypothetical protein